MVLPLNESDVSTVAFPAVPFAFVVTSPLIFPLRTRFVVVAFVVVEFAMETLLSVEEPAPMRPLLKVRMVLVALFWKRYAKPALAHDCGVTLPVVSIVRHWPLLALRPEMTRLVVEAFVAEIAVVEALLNVARPVKALALVNVFAAYVFAMVVEASAK